MALLLKIAPADFMSASRDKREISAAREVGFQVLTMCKGEKKDKGRREEIDGFAVARYGTRPLGSSSVMRIPNKILSVLQWAHHARKLGPDAISGHDLPGLGIGYLSSLFRRKKPLLIYDAHEFEIGRNVKRNRIVKFLVLHLERFLIKRCAFSIMVNDSIADRVMEVHKLKKRPLVVRNVSPYLDLDPQTIVARRKNFLKRLGVSKETFLLMYHGGLMQNRGIETLIHVVAAIENTAAIILGNGKAEYVDHLHDMCEKQGVRDRVLFLDTVLFSILSEYVGAADVGMVLIDKTSESYYLSLPNKFFENVQALTPMVASAFPEMKRLIDLYEIGLTVDPESQEDVLSAVRQMQDDVELYQRFKNNLVQAKEDLCWENEKAVLIGAYRGVYTELRACKGRG